MVIKEFFKRHKLTAALVSIIANVIFLLARRIYRRERDYGEILIISLHKLGDTVFTIPAVKFLVENLSDKFIIFCFEESKIIYQLVLPESEKLKYFTINRSGLKWENRLVRHKPKKDLMKNFNFKKIIDLTGGIFSANVIINSRVSSVIGCSELFYKSLYDIFSPKRRTPHLMDLYFDSVRLIFPNAGGNEAKYFPPNYNVNDPILIHPFAGWESKEWGVRNFIRLAVELAVHYQVKFILPADKCDMNLLQELLNNKIKYFKSESLMDLIQVTQNCSLLISNDSGPIHIASLLGKPTLTIFGPSNSSFAKPFGGHHKSIQKIINCSPGINDQYCYTDAGRNGCPSFECMKQLSVEEVLSEAKNLIRNLKIPVQRYSEVGN